MARTRFFLTRKDIDGRFVTNADRLIIYDELGDDRRKFTETSFRNTNFADIEKKDYAIGMIDLMREQEEMRREIIALRTREKFFMKKLIDNGISTAFTPQEIEQFKVTITTATLEAVDNIVNGELKDIREDILQKVGAVIAEAKHEWGKSPEYNIIRLTNMLEINEVIISDIAKSQMAKDKKASSIKGLQDVSLKIMKELNELVAKYAPKDTKKQNGSSNFNNDFTVDYSSMGE